MRWLRRYFRGVKFAMSHLADVDPEPRRCSHVDIKARAPGRAGTQIFKGTAMASSARSLLDAVWSKIASKSVAASPPAVVIHDPAADGAQDLDDPFLDPKARERAGKLIARAARGSKDPAS
jgi:hypothetical protein